MLVRYSSLLSSVAYNGEKRMSVLSILLGPKLFGRNIASSSVDDETRFDLPGRLPFILHLINCTRALLSALGLKAI